MSESTGDALWRELGLAAPARRALLGAGITRLADLTKTTRRDVAALHGMGPNALATLEPYFEEDGE